MEALRVALGVGELQELQELRRMRAVYEAEMEEVAPAKLQVMLNRIVLRAFEIAEPGTDTINIGIDTPDDATSDIMLFVDKAFSDESYVHINSIHEDGSYEEEDIVELNDYARMSRLLAKFPQVMETIARIDALPELSGDDGVPSEGVFYLTV